MRDILEPMYDVSTIAKHWGVNERTVRQWIENGMLRAIQPFSPNKGAGRTTRIPESAYQEFLERYTVNGVLNSNVVQAADDSGSLQAASGE